MSAYTAIIPNYLVDANDNVLGVVGPDGREWLFPATLVAAADGASFLGFVEMLFDPTNTPVGYLSYGAEYVFGSAFTLNTTRGYRTRARATLIAAGGQPIGVRSGAQSFQFPIPPSGGGAAAPGVSVTMTQLDANRIIQRTTTTGGGQGKGQASVPVALTFTGTQPIYARRRSTVDGTTILQAPWIANASATSGTITLSGIDVPAINTDGVTPTVTNDGWFYLDVASSSAGPWTNGTSAVTCGRLVAISGQSLAVRFIGRQDSQTATNASLGITISPYASVLAAYTETRTYLPTISTMPWAPPADGGNYDSCFVSEFTRRQIQQFGAPCGFVGYAIGAQPLYSFLTAGANGATLQAILARAGGAWESMIWYQGHSDNNAPPKAYRDGLTTLFAQLTTLNSFSGWAKYVGSIPNISSSSWGTPYQRNNVRAGVGLYCAVGGNNATHVQIEGIQLVDGVHPTQALSGVVWMGQNFARATMPEAGLTRGNNGPAFVSATRVGTTITMNFSDVGQGNLVLTGTPTDKIYVFSPGRVAAPNTTNNQWPISTITVASKTSLTVVLANDPGDAQALDVYYSWPQNDATIAAQIRDDRTDGDGITVGRNIVPNAVPYSVPAPNVGSGVVNAPPGGFVKNTSPYQLTNGGTAVSYGAQEETGYGQTASGGYSTVIGQCSWDTFTVEFSFTAPAAAPAASTALFSGPGGGGGGYMLLTTAMKLQSDAGLTGVTTLVASHRYRCAYTRGPNGTQLYLKDITASGAVVRDQNSATPYVKPLQNNGNFALRQFQNSYILVAAGATVDQIALSYGQLYSGASPTLSSAPYVGTEPDIYAIWNFDGDLTEVVAS